MTLCQVFQVLNENEFWEYIRNIGFPPRGAGWGKFKGEIPAINTTLQLEFDNKKEDRESEYFRVIHHHLVLRHKPIYYETSSEALNECSEQGDMEVEECFVYVVKTRPVST
jgi:hypothetical protein